MRIYGAKSMKPISSIEFVKKSIKVHGHLYDYSKVKYVGHHIPVEIICKVHGAFFQKPQYHILRKSGCPSCYRTSQQYNESTFLQKARERFGDRYSYGKYTGYREDMSITCNEHAHTFVTKPSNHLRKNGNGGCEKCYKQLISKPREEWIQEFTKIHGNKYDYSKVDVISSDKKMNVVCPEHGIFFPTAHNHARGHGCPTCACNNYIGGYSEEFFDKHPNRKQDRGTLYLLKIYNKQESFYKVGITNRSIEKRFKSVLPYEYEVVLAIPTTLYTAHLCEMFFIDVNKLQKYIPKRRFVGWTECFKDCDKNILLEKFDQITQSVLS